MSGSPQLIAGCHVLRRLPMPRHSPCALFSLNSTTEYLLFRRFSLLVLSLNYLSLANNCFGCISLFSQKTFLCFAYYRHFHDEIVFFTLDQQKNLCFLIDLNYLFVLLVSYSVFNEHDLLPLFCGWWAQVDSNHRPRAYQARALTC